MKLAALSLFTASIVCAGLPYTFIEKSPAKASEVNADFKYLDSLVQARTKDSITSDSAGNVRISGTSPSLVIGDKKNGLKFSPTGISLPTPSGSYNLSTKGFEISLEMKTLGGNDGSLIFSTQAGELAIGIDLNAHSNLAVSKNISVGGSGQISGNLTVNGALSAKAPLNIIPDFVFSPSYDLMPLSKIEEYTTKNQHLPGIPSAAELEQGNIDLVKMNFILLQKVEELTLHAIKQQKEIDELKARH